MVRSESDPGIDRRQFLSLAAAVGVLELTDAGSLRAADASEAVAIDYAYYNPVSLLLKKKRWLEAELAKDGIGLRWVLSLGSNKALEFLRGGSIDFGSTAGSAAIVARAGGVPIKAIYVYSKPEWTALVTRKDSGIGRLQDLKDKSVAVTRGTDPHIFLLRALDTKGLSENDVNAVLLQHPDGYRALATRQVDAWAGLDPHMAKAQVETGAVLFYRNQSFNTYGILNVREAFAKRIQSSFGACWPFTSGRATTPLPIRTNWRPNSLTPPAYRLRLRTSSLSNAPTCQRLRSGASIGRPSHRPARFCAGSASSTRPSTSERRWTAGSTDPICAASAESLVSSGPCGRKY